MAGQRVLPLASTSGPVAARPCRRGTASRPRNRSRHVLTRAQAKPIPTLDVADSLEATRNLLTDSPSQKSKLEEMREKYGSIWQGFNVTGLTVTVGQDALIKGLAALEPSEAVVPSWPPSAVEVLGSNSIVLANGKTHQAREERDAQQQDERSSTAPARRPPAAGPEASDETHAATPAQVLKRALTPAFFSKPRLRALHTYIQARTYETLSKAAVTGSVFRRAVTFKDTVEPLYFDIAARAAVGILSDAEKGRLDRCRVGLFEGLFVFVPEWMSPARQRAKTYRDDMMRIIRRIIAERRAGAREGEPGDAVGVLLEAVDENGNPYSDEDIATNCLAMLFAGTTAMANAATSLACLTAANAEARAALLAEIATWPEEERRPGGFIDFDRLTDSPVFESVVSEALRWAPPIPGLFRRVEKDVELGGYNIPAGTSVISSVFLQSNDPATYAEPQRFCPMRFVPGWSKHVEAAAAAGGAPHGAAQAVAATEGKPSVFGAGPHLCLGQELAKLDLKVLLALLVRDFEAQLEAPAEAPEEWVPTVSDGLKRKDDGRMVLRFREGGPTAAA